MTRLAILIPAYNESERIVPTLEKYCEHFKDRAAIIVVANGCTDNTARIVSQVALRYSNLRLLVVNGKIGKGGAIRVGLKTAMEEYVGFADADGSTDPAEFDRLFEECVRRGSDGLIGSRWMAGAVVEPRQPLKRRLASRAFNMMVRMLFGLPFADTQCGAKVFRRAALRTILNSLEVADFAFDIEVLWKLREQGFHVDEVATKWSDRAAGTKIQLVATSWNMLKTIVRMRVRTTMIWRFPFLEFFARDSIIPVKSGINVLLLAPPSFDSARAAERAWANECVRELETHGCTVTWCTKIVRATGKHSPWNDFLYWLRFNQWYACESARRYDAVIEIASGAPAFLPAASLKRKFLCLRKRAPAFARAIYRLLYRRLDFEFCGDELPLYVAATLMEQIGAGALYRAAFHENEGAWSLRFNDLDSGLWTLQTLE